MRLGIPGSPNQTEPVRAGISANTRTYLEELDSAPNFAYLALRRVWTESNRFPKQCSPKSPNLGPDPSLEPSNVHMPKHVRNLVCFLNPPILILWYSPSSQNSVLWCFHRGLIYECIPTIPIPYGKSNFVRDLLTCRKFGTGENGETTILFDCQRRKTHFWTVHQILTNGVRKNNQAYISERYRLR